MVILGERTTTGAGNILIAASDSTAKAKARADFLCTATDNDVVLTAAVAALPAAGGAIQFAEGAFSFASANTITKPNVRICGYGPNTVLDGLSLTFQGTNTTTPITGCAIRDCTINGRVNLSNAIWTLLENLVWDADGADYCLHSTGASYFTHLLDCYLQNAVIDNAYFDNLIAGGLRIVGNHVLRGGRDGIHIEKGSTLYGSGIDGAQNTLIQGNFCRDNWRHGIHVENNHDIQIQNNNVDRNGMATAGQGDDAAAGIYVKNPCQLQITGNNLEYNYKAGVDGKGIWIDLNDGADEAITQGQGIISGNYLMYEGDAIYIYSSNVFPYKLDIIGNSVGSPWNSSCIRLANYMRQHVINIQDNCLAGISKAAYTYGVWITPASGETDGSNISVNGGTICDLDAALRMSAGLLNVRFSPDRAFNCTKAIYLLTAAGIIIGDNLELSGNTADTSLDTGCTITRKASNAFLGSRHYTATVTVDVKNGESQKITLAAGANTITIANAQYGARLLLELRQPATGAAGTVTWPANVMWPAATAPTLTTTNSYEDLIELIYVSTGRWMGRAVAQNYYLKDAPPTDAIRHFKCNDTTGLPTVVDATGTANATAGSAVTSVAGKIGTALHLNEAESTDKIVLGSDVIGTGDFSFAAWMKIDAATGTGGGAKLLDNTKFLVWFNNGVIISLTQDAAGTIDTMYTVSLGTTYHFAITRTGTTVKFYVNGELVKTSTSCGNPTSGATNTAVGGGVGGNGRNFGGWVDDIRIYNRVLSADEIASIYALGNGTEDGN